MKFEVFSRRAWRKQNGEFVPAHDARITHVAIVHTVEEARKLCAEGPANKARHRGHEYRNLSFYEFRSV